MNIQKEETKPLNMTDAKYLAFNVNHNILVKLNDLGYKRLADLHNDYLGIIPNWKKKTAGYYKKKADKN